MTQKRRGMKVRGKTAKANKAIDEGNIKAMANSMRVQILTILNERANSATGIGRELGIEPNKLHYDIEVLRNIGRIKVVEEKKRRGAVEVFYKATDRAYLDEHEWPTVPDPVKGGLRASLLKSIMDDATVAIAEETYDSLDEAHMSWTPVIVDMQGWERLTEILRRALEDILDEARDSALRLAKKDVEGMSCTVSILGYRSAVEDRKVGPPISPQELNAAEAKATKAGSSVKRERKTQRKKR